MINAQRPTGTTGQVYSACVEDSTPHSGPGARSMVRCMSEVGRGSSGSKCSSAGISAGPRSVVSLKSSHAHRGGRVSYCSTNSASSREAPLGPLRPFSTAKSRSRADLGRRNDVQRKSQTTRDPLDRVRSRNPDKVARSVPQSKTWCLAVLWCPPAASRLLQGCSRPEIGRSVRSDGLLVR